MRPHGAIIPPLVDKYKESSLAFSPAEEPARRTLLLCGLFATKAAFSDTFSHPEDPTTKETRSHDAGIVRHTGRRSFS
jgi:hypothetical protein